MANGNEATKDNEIVISRIINAPRERVWRAFTDPKAVVQWWGPSGFTNTLEEMDVKPGGVWKHVMHGPDGTDYPNYSVFEEVKAPEKLVYKLGSNADDAMFLATATVTFESQPDNKTKLTLRLAFADKAQRDMTIEKVGAIEGGNQTLGRLAAFLALESLGSKPMTLVRVFNAPVERVWRAWTVPEEAMKWWGPRAYSCPVAKIDFRVGGKSLLAMRGADGKDIWSCGVYREIVPNKRIVTTDSFSDEKGNVVSSKEYGMEGIPLEMMVVVDFEDMGGKTKMTLRHFGLPLGEHDLGASVGWGESFDKMDEMLAKN